jgi:hypothetical protein
VGAGVTGLANMSGMASVVGTGAAAAGTAALLVGIGAAAFTATTALLEWSDKLKQSNEQERSKTANAQYFEGTSSIANANNPLERSAAYQKARNKIIKDEEQRTGASWGASGTAASPQARAALEGVDKFFADIIAKEQNQKENAASIGAEGRLTEAGLAAAIVGAMVGKTMNVKVNNTNDFNFTPADGGGGNGGGPRKNTNGFWD